MFGDETLTAILKPKATTPAWKTRMLQGPLTDWWRAGIDQMMKDRHKLLE